MHTRYLALVLLLAGNAGCVGEQAVRDFAAASQQAASLLPRVAAISFNACVEQHIFQQVSHTEARDLTDRSAAEQACVENARARDQLVRVFSVVSKYLDLLSRLAAGASPAYDESVKDVASEASSLAGVDAKQASALTGLGGVIAKSYLHARQRAAISRTITEAEPHLQILCSAFKDDIQRFILLTLRNEESELKALYGDESSSGANRLLLYRQFESELATISSNRELAERYAVIVTAIAKGHGELFARRDHLGSRETLQAVFQSVTVIQKQLGSIREATR